MAPATKTIEPVTPPEDQETILSTEDKAAARKEAKAARAAQQAKNRQEAQGKRGTGTRTVRVGRHVKVEVDENIPWPASLDYDNFFPTAYAAVVEKLGETIDDTEFSLDEDKLVGLAFAKPNVSGGNRPLYVVKAITQDGRIVQLPFEDQINNTVAGDRSDAIGLRRYAREGFIVLIDWNTLVPLYCAALDCWARAMVPELEGQYPAHRGVTNSGFCSAKHRAGTMPFQFTDAGEIKQGLMSQGVTTSRVWEVGK